MDLKLQRTGSVAKVPEEPSTTRLIPATEWSGRHQWPSIGGIRHLVFNAHRNGFDAVVRRVGRRVLIDETAFFAWVEAQQEAHK